MNYLKEWLETILYMNVFLLIIDSLVKTTKYEKYFHFFSGFLLMLCLIKPLVDFSFADGFMDASFLQNELKNEWQLIGNSEDFKEMKDDIRQTYADAVENQICEIAASYDISVTEVQIRWKGDSEEMNILKIEGESLKESGHSPRVSSLRDDLVEFYHLDADHINIEIQE